MDPLLLPELLPVDAADPELADPLLPDDVLPLAPGIPELDVVAAPPLEEPVGDSEDEEPEPSSGPLLDDPPAEDFEDEPAPGCEPPDEHPESTISSHTPARARGLRRAAGDRKRKPESVRLKMVRIWGHSTTQLWQSPSVSAQNPSRRHFRGRINFDRQRRAFDEPCRRNREGVAEDRIETAGSSYEAPVADNESQEGRARNRRADIVLLGR
jgi:hypothetical protein